MDCARNPRPARGLRRSMPAIAIRRVQRANRQEAFRRRNATYAASSLSPQGADGYSSVALRASENFEWALDRLRFTARLPRGVRFWTRGRTRFFPRFPPSRSSRPCRFRIEEMRNRSAVILPSGSTYRAKPFERTAKQSRGAKSEPAQAGELYRDRHARVRCHTLPHRQPVERRRACQAAQPHQIAARTDHADLRALRPNCRRGRSAGWRAGRPQIRADTRPHAPAGSPLNVRAAPRRVTGFSPRPAIGRCALGDAGRAFPPQTWAAFARAPPLFVVVARPAPFGAGGTRGEETATGRQACGCVRAAAGRYFAGVRHGRRRWPSS